MITSKIFDIECFLNFFLLVTRDIETHEYQTYQLEDRLFTDLIHNPNVNLIGWNNHSYDNLLLNYIAQESVPSTSGWGKQAVTEVSTYTVHTLSNRIINGPKDDPYIKQLRFAETMYHSQDIKALLDPVPGLKKIEMRTGFHNVQDLPLPPDTKLTNKQKQIITEYCHNDVDATYERYLAARDHIQLREYLAGRFNLPVERLRSASEPRTAEYILSTEATRYTNRRPWQIKNELQLMDAQPNRVVNIKDCIPQWIKFRTPELSQTLDVLLGLVLSIDISTGYAQAGDIKQIVTVANKDYQLGIGGLHSIDSPGIFYSNNTTQLIEADVTSYYPSILIRDRLHPRGYETEWIDAYEQIYTDRLQAKNDSDRSTEAYALKIILNATFGKFGSQYSSFYDPTLLLRVTLTGQLALLMLIEACAEKQIEVLSANTDGIMINLLDHQADDWASICHWWQKHTRFTLEYTHYQTYARRDVNSYTALTIDNKIKNKGVFAPPDIKHDVQAPIIQTLARRYLLYNEDLEINLEQTTIHDFIFHFGANKNSLRR
jgi:hypothetical protein